MTRSKKVVTIVWIAILLSLLAVEWIVVTIPHVESINLQSPEIAGTEITVPTDINGVLNPTTTSAEPLSGGETTILQIMPILFGVAVVWKVVQSLAINEKEK